MIVFLSLVYVVVLVVLVKLRVIKLNLFWKLSPVLWMIALFFVLFVPMQWDAPSGPLNTSQSVIEVVPNVSGEVLEVAAEGNQRMQKDDVLFTIDPQPYQFQVDRLTAALAEAEQAVPQLEAAFDATIAAAERAKYERQQAQLEVERGQPLLERNAISQQDFDQRQLRLDAATATVAELTALRERARLAFASEVDGVNTTVAQLEAQLADARYKLDQTVVRAPADGFVAAMFLSPGQRVTSVPLRSWMAFVREDSRTYVVWINQSRLRFVRPGASAEMTFKLFPGKIFDATVESVVYISGEGQLQPTGVLPSLAQLRQSGPGAYAVRLSIDEFVPIAETVLPIDGLPAAATGTAAIYTDTMKPTQIIRRVMIRMEAWMNYIRP